MATPMVRALTLALVIAVAAAVYVVRIRSGMSDFEVYHRTGSRLAAGENLYQTADGHYMFKYLPASAVFYLPFSLMPMEAAKACWFALSLAALAGVVVLSARLAGELRPYVAAIAVAVLAKYFLHELRLGQINLFVTVLVLASTNRLLDAAASGRAAGTLAGFGVALKPYAAPLVGYFALRRHWQALLAAIVTIVILQLVPVFFFGLGGTIDQLRLWATTLSASTPVLLTNNDNISIVAFFTKWLGDPARAMVPAMIVLAVLGVVMLAVIAAGRRQSRAAALDVAMILTATPLVSPLGWDYTLLMSLPAVMMIVNDLPAFPRVIRIALIVNFAVIALSLYDIFGARAYSTFMQWSVTTVNFLVVVVALAYLRWTGRR